MTPPDDPDTDRWREALSALGFSDDGDKLRGPVPWQHPTAGSVTARVQVTPDARFPFAPPNVVVLDPGADVEFTFHIDADQTLCLWENDWAVDEAPWREPAHLLTRIAGWLEQTAAGWPGDDVCDLERYFPDHSATMVLYEYDKLVPGRAVRTKPGPAPRTCTVTTDERQLRDFDRRRPALHRKDKRLAWIADVGETLRPLRSWDDVRTALGADGERVRRRIAFGAVTLLVLRYRRNGQPAVVALEVQPVGDAVRVVACESADTGPVTRSLRAGPNAGELAEARVAIVGCGAIGSYTADYLFRAGVRAMTLRDVERLRPGNVVRHLAGLSQVGLDKPDAVRVCLARIDPDVDTVRTQARSLRTLAEALDLLRDHDVVVDATGNARASSLLATAAGQVGNSMGHSVVSVCTQRDGTVLRVDRLPLRGSETYLPALPRLEDTHRRRERGCGDPVSPTPPGAVVAAAELAHRVVIDEATRACSLPATIVDVREAQPESPFDTTGIVTSEGWPA